MTPRLSCHLALLAALLATGAGAAVAAEAQAGAGSDANQDKPAWLSQLAPPPPRSFAVPVSPAAPAARVAPSAPVAPAAPLANAAPVSPAAPAAPLSPSAPGARPGNGQAQSAILRGTLGDAQIQATLRPKFPAEDGIEGSYFVFGGKQNILLAGEIDGENLWMEESENGVDVSGQWEGIRKGEVVEGTWQSVDGSVSKPFQLKFMSAPPAQP